MAAIHVSARECVVYWLYDETCICPQLHGYVGISSAIERRINQHRRRFAQFQWAIIFTGTKADCLARERELRPIIDIGWNRSRGGKPTINYTDEVRRKLSVSRQGKVTSEETRRKLAETSRGRTNKGRPGPKSVEEKAKIGASNKGKKRTEETKQLLSLRKIGTAFHKGFLHSEETKRQISFKKRGRQVHSEEHKRHLSDRWKGNSLTKGKPWSAARRLAWLSKQEK